MPSARARRPDNLAFLTQTTLSVDDTAAIVAALTRRFPAIRAPRSEDICYATSNRQAAVKAIARSATGCW
jgi:4-hydroxy-3-methylbut-2-enyl diphosphate reductase